ncbi:MAG: DUF4388 domain-containing protein, partial [Deltaproteobacteria bacterium]|nr:DUF4388 domain-containing protein [Deltaproteobacteria bacterium]
ADKNNSSNQLFKHVLFSGRIYEGSLIEYFNFIGENNKTGALVIISGPMKKSIFFKDGQIRFCTSNVKDDLLGEILYRYGIVDKKSLKTALSDKTRKLGESLVAMGKINVTDLYQAIKLQVEEICYSSFLLTDGSFYFYELTDENMIPSSIHLVTRNVILEGVRRIDEMSHFKKKLPSPDVILEINPEASVTSLKKSEIETFKLIDGKITLRELSRRNHLGLFETTRIIFNLLQGGYVKIKSRSSIISDISSGKDNIKQLVEAYNRVFKYIWSKTPGIQDKLQSDLSTFITKMEGELALLFNGVKIKEQLQLDYKKIAENMSEHQTDKANLFTSLIKASDEILYFLLFSSGITIEPQIEEELQKLVRNLTAK